MPFLHQDRTDPRVLDEEAHPLLRIARVDGEVGGAGLHRAQHPDHHLVASVRIQPEDRVGGKLLPGGGGTVASEGRRESVGPLVELAVSDRLSPELESALIRVLQYRVAENLQQRRVSGLHRVVPGPRVEDQRPLFVRHYHRVGHEPVGMRDHPLDGFLHVPADPIDHILRERVGVVRDLDEQSLGGPDDHGDGVVGLLPEVDVLDRESPDLFAHRVVLEEEKAVEQRGARRCLAVAVYLRQRQEAIFIDLVHDAVQPAQVLRRRQVVGDIEGEGDRVDQQADHPLHAFDLAGAPRDGHPHDHVVAAAEPAEDDGPGQLYERVERDALPAREQTAVLGKRPGKVMSVFGEVPYRLVGIQAAPGAAHGERRRSFHRSHQLRPEVHRLATIARAGPPHVLLEWR